MNFIFESTVCQVVFWLVLALVFAIIEAITLGLTTIWFAGGSVAALISGILGAEFWLQFIIFLCVSIVLIAFTRKIFIKKLGIGNNKTNTMTLIGERGKAMSDINFDGAGRVRVGTQEWSAMPQNDDDVIKAGADVEILEIKGVKVIVREIVK